MGRLYVVTCAAIALLALPGSAWAQESPCTGETSAAGVEQQPGPRLRFGINPAGPAGAVGPAVEPVPEDRSETMRHLARLRPSDGIFRLRLNRFFWSDGREGIQRFSRLANRYTSHGYPVELQLRYHPRPGQEGRIGRWLNFVRRVVTRFGANELVTAIQVTNEVNFYPVAPDASDAAYDGARAALVRGVKVAHRTTERHGYDQLEVGFNWAYRTDPANEQSFWTYLRDHGGPKFVGAVDWVGLDAYPGTVFPLAEPLPGDFRDGMVNAMSTLRECYLPIAGIPSSVPMRVEENGYPTEDVVRPYSEQVRAMREMVHAVDDFRGTYHVTDYRWFDLRDHRTSSSNFQHHYGLLTDDYEPKPAFGVYRRLVDRLSR